MTDSIRLGRVAGVAVGLNWSLIVMIVLVAGGLADNRFPFSAPGYPAGAYAAAGAATAVGLLVGVLLHELGHAVVARRSGLAVDGITLSWMGGVTRIQGEAARPASELVVAGVGPLVSVAFGSLLWLVRLALEGPGQSHLLISALGWLAGLNVVLAVFNLIPAAPLDGGRVLHSLVWAATHDRWKASRAAGMAGLGLGGLMVAGGFVTLTRTTTDPVDGLLVTVLGWWILGSARSEMSYASVRRTLGGLRLADVMRPVGAAPGWITVRAFADSYSTGRPGWVWLLEKWDGGYGGVILGDALAAVPFAQWDLVRPLDVSVPIASTVGASPTDEALEVLARASDKQVVLVVDGGHTVGAVLPGDLEALVRMGGRAGAVNRRPVVHGPPMEPPLR